MSRLGNNNIELGGNLVTYHDLYFIFCVLTLLHYNKTIFRVHFLAINISHVSCVKFYFKLHGENKDYSKLHGENIIAQYKLFFSLLLIIHFTILVYTGKDLHGRTESSPLPDLLESRSGCL
jgi:hypothetical protein